MHWLNVLPHKTIYIVYTKGSWAKFLMQMCFSLYKYDVLFVLVSELRGNNQKTSNLLNLRTTNSFKSWNSVSYLHPLPPPPPKKKKNSFIIFCQPLNIWNTCIRFIKHLWHIFKIQERPKMRFYTNDKVPSPWTNTTGLNKEKNKNLVL